MNNNLKQEVILKKNGEIQVVRVLLEFNIPLVSYPDSGVWSYLIKTGPSTVTIFDVGPKYKALLPIRRSKSGDTHNTDKIISTLDKYFPDHKVEQLICSHYHYDHTENAPDLQMSLRTRQDEIPPIRLHQRDLEAKKMFGFMKTHLDDIFEKAGYTEWHIGDSVREGEKLGESGFEIVHTPGHTSGAISLINNQEEIAITGWWVEEISSPVVKFVQGKLIDEDTPRFRESIEKMKKNKYKYYYLHPKVDKY